MVPSGIMGCDVIDIDCQRITLLLSIMQNNLTQWVSNIPGSFQIHCERQYLVNVILYGIQDLQTSEITVKFKSNLYVGPINNFPIVRNVLLLYDW